MLFFSRVARGTAVDQPRSSPARGLPGTDYNHARKARRVMTAGNPCGTGGTTETKGVNKFGAVKFNCVPDPLSRFARECVHRIIYSACLF